MRLLIEEGVEALDDDDAVVGLDADGGGERVLERVGEGREGEGWRGGDGEEGEDEGVVGGGVEGEGRALRGRRVESVAGGSR